MKIAILGYGVEGLAAYQYWLSPDNRLTVCDQNEHLELPADITKQLGDNYLQGLEAFDLIVRSPGILPSAIVAANSPEVLSKVTTNCNEFFRVCPTKHIIGVTGTKGKGTTSTLIAKLLEAAGKTVHLGGNIGVPPLTLLSQGIEPNDWVVLELSSFQLADFIYAPAIGVCLMMAAEHLNWHQDMADYVAAKSHLFAKQTPADRAVYFAEDKTSEEIASSGAGQKIPYFQAPGALVQDNNICIADQIICSVNELKLLGQHNWQNVCAALTAVWQVTQDVTALRQVLTSFTGLEHRLEFVREIDGIKYYDDSFGTTPETAIVALQAFEQPKVVILGGSDKGASYDDLASTVATANVRAVILIGKTASKIQTALEKVGFTNFTAGGSTMTDIVQTTRNQAQPGDVVLLSTANASFDMFENYKDRGEQFKTAVQALV